MSETASFRLGNIQNYAEAEQVAAGWPAWLSAVAGEAINGLVPLRADSFQTLEKIGQGTYSTVFQARDLDSGRIVALKKVRFDHLEPGNFGLANFCNLRRRKPLTSRVVTLWYRPPELLLGSTNYGASVDLWSVGCVFGELLTGRPILRGRTEVEQLHKIFKLCGSPPDEYWTSSKLPRATLFKPQHNYESCIWEAFRNLPKDAASLIETLLRVEPHKRGTAASALASEVLLKNIFTCVFLIAYGTV
nr:probable serine/threonine-protein kinase At1g54610 [Ipomoea batatas]